MRDGETSCGGAEAGGTLGHAMERAAGMGGQEWRRLGIVGQV